MKSNRLFIIPQDSIFPSLVALDIADFSNGVAVPGGRRNLLVEIVEEGQDILQHDISPLDLQIIYDKAPEPGWVDFRNGENDIRLRQIEDTENIEYIQVGRYERVRLRSGNISDVQELIDRNRLTNAGYHIYVLDYGVGKLE